MTYNVCEKKFQEWLKKKYPYIFIDQSREPFSTLIGNVETKRSDFLLVLQQIGIIAVNIKDCINVGWEDGIQRIFNFPITFCIFNFFTILLLFSFVLEGYCF